MMSSYTSCSSTYGTNYVVITTWVLTCSCSLLVHDHLLHVHRMFFQVSFLHFKMFHAQLLTPYLYEQSIFNVCKSRDIHMHTVLLVPTVHNHLVEVIFSTLLDSTGLHGPTKCTSIYISSNKLTTFNVEILHSNLPSHQPCLSKWGMAWSSRGKEKRRRKRVRLRLPQ